MRKFNKWGERKTFDETMEDRWIKTVLFSDKCCNRQITTTMSYFGLNKTKIISCLN